MKQATIATAVSIDDYAAAKDLFEEYAAALGVDLCFQGFDEELASLPAMYGPPRGCLLLARTDGKTVGCVALRELSATQCEMKRLYVQPHQRATGLGRRLAEAVITRARRLGYTRMVLDTLPAMTEAQTLYASLGFRDVEPYYRNPLPGVRYLACELGPLAPDGDHAR